MRLPSRVKATSAGKTNISGKWRITKMDLWDQEAIDLLGPAFIEFKGARGQFRFVEAYLEFAEETGLTTEDCHALATLLVTRRTPSMCCRGWSAGSSSRRRHRTAQWRDMTSPN